MTFTFEVLLLLFTIIPSVLISILSYRKFTKEKGSYINTFRPFQFIWAKAFFYMSASFILTLLYIITFEHVKDFSQYPLLRFDFVVAIKIFETFSIFEFLKIGYHINYSRQGKKYIDKEKQFALDIISVSIFSLDPFFIILNNYDDFFSINSQLLQSQVTGYKYFDAIIIAVHIAAFYFIVKEIGINDKQKHFQAIVVKQNSIFALFQKILQLANIMFFNYTILIFVYIEWIPTLFSVWVIFYKMYRESIDEKY